MKNLSYYIDAIYVERCHRFLSQEVVTLSDMIGLVRSYRDMTDNIQYVIKERHKSCGFCSECGQSTGDGGDGDVDDILNGAVLYYTGLTESQALVLDRLRNCVNEMVAIDEMVGMNTIKGEFVRLLKFLATIDPDELRANSFLMHMVIMGPPGHGKTEIAKLLGNAFKKSGLLSSSKFVIATRANLIGKYCGHTARETTNMFDKARGGVIFIDEVYSLGNPEKRDVFTGECINTINQLLSERSDTLCIIAGYEKEIDTCFFAYNPGLERRFPWRFKIKEYSCQDLVNIFIKKVNDMGREVEEGALRAKDIEQHRDMFQNAGGDMVNLVTNCLLAYYDNSFLGAGAGAGTNVLSRRDVLSGLERYLANKDRGKGKDLPPPGMYM